MTEDERIEEIATILGEIVRDVLAELRDQLARDRVRDEPSFSAKLVALVEERVKKDARLQHAGIVSTVRALTSDRESPEPVVLPVAVPIMVEADVLADRGGEEARIGADIVVVIALNIGALRWKKGFLAQSKRIEGRSMSGAEWEALSDQRELMESITEESYVWVYSRDDTSSSRSKEVADVSREDFRRGTGQIDTIFEETVLCLRGDRNLTATDRRSLEELANRIPARNALLIKFANARRGKKQTKKQSRTQAPPSYRRGKGR